jgi:hypothetical protein
LNYNQAQSVSGWLRAARRLIGTVAAAASGDRF